MKLKVAILYQQLQKTTTLLSFKTKQDLIKSEDVNKIYAGKQLLLPSLEIDSADAPFVAPESVKRSGV